MKLSLIEAMKETNNSHLIDPFLFAIATGLRKSNLINLKKENVLDEIRGRVIRLPDLEMKNGEHFTQYLSPHTDSIIKRNWHKEKTREGGGTSYLLTGGKIFDKVGVNKSTVSGIFLSIDSGNSGNGVFLLIRV